MGAAIIAGASLYILKREAELAHRRDMAAAKALEEAGAETGADGRDGR